MEMFSPLRRLFPQFALVSIRAPLPEGPVIREGWGGAGGAGRCAEKAEVAALPSINLTKPTGP